MRREERLDDAEEAIRAALDGKLAGVWTACPGIILDVDLVAQTVSVQPAVQGVVRSPGGRRRLVDLPVLIHVPLVWPRGGGFALTFPVAAGDEVLVVFSARAIDSWWQSGGVGAPVEARTHDLSDGFAVLAPTSQPRRLEGVSAANVQLRNDLGTTYVEIDPAGNVGVVADGDVAVTATGDIEANADGKVSVFSTGELKLQSFNTVTVIAPNVTVQADIVSMSADTLISLNAPSILANGTPIP